MRSLGSTPRRVRLECTAAARQLVLKTRMHVKVRGIDTSALRMEWTTRGDRAQFAKLMVRKHGCRTLVIPNSRWSSKAEYVAWDHGERFESGTGYTAQALARVVSPPCETSTRHSLPYPARVTRLADGLARFSL